MKVKINTYGSVNKRAGWNAKKVNVDKQRITIEGILSWIKLPNGDIVLNLVYAKNGIKKSYTILLNDLPLWNTKDLKREVRNNANITTMDILYPISGG